MAFSAFGLVGFSSLGCPQEDDKVKRRFLLKGELPYRIRITDPAAALSKAFFVKPLSHPLG